MKQAKADPRVSCPIVCGEYMRASGFFFATDTQTYLITACHNLLPVNATTLTTGDWSMNFKTQDTLPIIDLYLQNTPRVQHRIDIHDTSGVRYSANLDVVGIPIDLTPQNYGYTVWTPADIASPGSLGNTIDTMGFPGYSFPSSNTDYDVDQYANEITNPYILTLRTESPSQPIDTGLIKIGIDADTGTQSSEYNGFSGSPILGDGLVGIHTANEKISSTNPHVGNCDDEMAILYWRADILPHLLTS